MKRYAADDGWVTVELAFGIPAVAALAIVLAGVLAAASAQASAAVAARDAARMLSRGDPPAQVVSLVRKHCPGLVDPRIDIRDVDGGTEVAVSGRSGAFPGPLGRWVMVRAQMWVPSS